MSTTDSESVAKSYAASRRGLIFEYVTQGNSRGVEIADFSMYPKEREFLYPVSKVGRGKAMVQVDRGGQEVLVMMLVIAGSESRKEVLQCPWCVDWCMAPCASCAFTPRACLLALATLRV